MRGRLDHITFLQFIGPIFVILGHTTNNGMPSNEFYHAFTKDWIYIFHMPLFFFISGYIFSYKNGLKDKSYINFIDGKFQRLLMPYILWNLLFIIPKFIMSNQIADNVEFSFSYFLDLLITPRAMIWGHTWFLAALFLLFLLSPIFHLFIEIKRYRGFIWSIITMLLILWYINPSHTEVFALRDLSKDTLFFWTGIMIGRVSIDRLISFVTKPLITFSIFAMTVIFTFIELVYSDLSVITMVTCFLTIFSLLIIPIVFDIKSGFIDKIAQRSFGIYILHWPVMITVQIILYNVLNINSNIVIAVMALSGFLIPNLILWLVYRMQLTKFKKTQRYLLGV